MAKIVRKTAKIFGLNAGVNQIAQFGSLAASAPVFTIDPAIIQALSNYLGGWFQGVEGANSPAIEDMNALCYLFAYQIASIMQDGISSYDSATVYYQNSWVSYNGVAYVSLTDTNTGVTPGTDYTKWFTPTQNGLVTPTTLGASLTVAANTTLAWPNLSLSTGVTVTVPTNAYFNVAGKLVLSGTAKLVVSGGSARIH